MTQPAVESLVVDCIVQWALTLERPTGQTRVNRKLLFGSLTTAKLVAEALSERSDESCAYIVRSSTDADAVKVRNERPANISPSAGVVYLVFWHPGHRGHERNFESLRDFPSVTLEDFLSNATSFLLAAETGIASQCVEAASAWAEKDRSRAGEHLLAAWTALRTCLREKRGGRDRAIPFVEALDDYLVFLANACVPSEAWQALPESQRASALVTRWGAALPYLGMFTLPALASVIGVQVDPSQPIPSAKTSGEAKWNFALEDMLAENKDAATDFAGLEEDIAGKQTLRERLGDLATRIPLCQDQTKRPSARTALEAFCQSGDESALAIVEWLFRQNPGDRRSGSQGLKGLLIARKLRAPRENPLDKACRETTELIETLAGEDARESGVVRQYVEERKTRLAQSPREAALMAEILRSLAAGTVPTALATTALNAVCDRVLGVPERSPASLERLARAWEKLGRADGDAPVVAESLLLGLVQLSYARLREHEGGSDIHKLIAPGDGVAELVLNVAVEGERATLRLPVADWGERVRAGIHRWLLEKVRPLYFDDEEPAAEDNEYEVTEAITVDVELARGGVSSAFGVIEIPLPTRRAELVVRTRNHALVSIKGDGLPPSGRLLSSLFETSATVAAEDPRDDALSASWAAYVRALSDLPGWASIACISPQPRDAEAWVQEWSRCVAGVGVRASLDDELRILDEQFDREDDPVVLKQIKLRQKEIAKVQQSGASVDVRTVRSLLRLCTGRIELAGQPRHVVLTPHHPLVLRLRLVEERVLSNTLGQLWTQGWDARTLDDLDGALDDWGLPEPIHCYGFWDGDPLVFDTWLENGFALFSLLGAGSEADAQGLGVRQVARELERYAGLFPAAADRLRLRFQGDVAGRWAWSVLSERLDSSSFAADIELVTLLPSRQPSAIDLGVRADELLGRAFEPGADGSLPRIRAARRNATGEERSDVHISAVVGDLVEQFRSTITPTSTGLEAAGYDKFDERVLFRESVPDLLDYSFLVGDAPDDLSRAVSKAVGFAAAQPNQVFRERYSFDPTKCRHPLQELQKRAHWLVLASRQPLYRAVQQCGTSTLLDFYSATERGRAVHVCVSLDTRNSHDDVLRLRRMLDTLCGTEITEGETEGFLGAARVLAPGLAIRCISSTGGVDLSGLVGLLLSAHATKADKSGGLLLALDQHRDLLSGRGQLSDLLRIRMSEQQVRIDVVEAKFSTGELTLTSSPLLEAQQQVRSTVQRLAQFSLQHALILRTRARLARAIVHRLHLGSPEVSRANEWKELVEAVLDPNVGIVIGGGESGSIHAWSLHSATQEASGVSDGGETLRIHNREQALRTLRAL